MWSSCSRSSPSSMSRASGTDVVRLMSEKVTIVSGLFAEHRLAHQELVEIRIDERPHDRVDLPFVVPDAGGDIDHGRFVAAEAPLASRGPGLGPGPRSIFGEDEGVSSAREAGRKGGCGREPVAPNMMAFRGTLPRTNASSCRERHRVERAARARKLHLVGGRAHVMPSREAGAEHRASPTSSGSSAEVISSKSP